MKDRYTGYQTVILNEQQLADFYTDPVQLNLDAVENEYFILCNEDGQVVDKQCFQNGIFRPLNYRTVRSWYAGNFKSKNLQQSLAFDMLQDNTTPIKILTGRFGSGNCIATFLQ